MVAIYRSLKGTLGGLGGGKGGDFMGFGKSNVKVFGLDTKIKTKFKDVAG